MDFVNYGEELIPKGVVMPSVNIPEANGDNASFLRRISEAGMKERGVSGQQYQERVDYELMMFEELKYTDYILAVWDMCNFARKSDIATGLGRGSCAGSLVLYLIGVTGVDPIKYDLFFERFVSKARAKNTVIDGVTYFDGSLLCDIDMDFDYNDRQKIIEYINKKYAGQTAHILTTNTFSGKLCFKEVMKIFGGYSEEDANEISAHIPKKFGNVEALDKARVESPKFDAFCKQNERLYQIARKMEDLTKNYGVHASGVAIGHKTISHLLPMKRTSEGKLITGVEMKWAAECTVKFDILGLKTTSTLKEACRLAGISSEEIDINHPSIYAALQDLESPQGIFQIEADSQFGACRKIKPANMGELADLLAIARPGAMDYIDDYVDVKNDPALKKCIHPEMDKILEKTKGIVLFQETLLEVGKKVFNLSLEQAELIRRACGKKLKEEMDKWYPVIYENAEKLGVDKKVADFYVKCLEDSASYSFNKCLSPDSLVQTRNGTCKISDVLIGEEINSFDVGKGQNTFVKIIDKIQSRAILYEVELENGKKIKCSMDHKFLTKNGMIPLKEIVNLDLSILTI